MLLKTRKEIVKIELRNYSMVARLLLSPPGHCHHWVDHSEVIGEMMVS